MRRLPATPFVCPIARGFEESLRTGNGPGGFRRCWPPAGSRPIDRLGRSPRLVSPAQLPASGPCARASCVAAVRSARQIVRRKTHPDGRSPPFNQINQSSPDSPACAEYHGARRHRQRLSDRAAIGDACAQGGCRSPIQSACGNWWTRSYNLRSAVISGMPSRCASAT